MFPQIVEPFKCLATFPALHGSLSYEAQGQLSENCFPHLLQIKDTVVNISFNTIKSLLEYRVIFKLAPPPLWLSPMSNGKIQEKKLSYGIL